MQNKKRKERISFWDTDLGYLIFGMFCVGVMVFILWLGSLIYYNFLV